MGPRPPKDTVHRTKIATSPRLRILKDLFPWDPLKYQRRRKQDGAQKYRHQQQTKPIPRRFQAPVFRSHLTLGLFHPWFPNQGNGDNNVSLLEISRGKKKLVYVWHLLQGLANFLSKGLHRGRNQIYYIGTNGTRKKTNVLKIFLEKYKI